MVAPDAEAVDTAGVLTGVVVVDELLSPAIATSTACGDSAEAAIAVVAGVAGVATACDVAAAGIALAGAAAALLAELVPLGLIR